MLTLDEIIKNYFPKEKILNSYSGSLKKEVNKVFNIPFSYFRDPKIELYQGIRIIETENYWFIDGRYKIRPINIVLVLICFGFFGSNNIFCRN